MTTEPSQGYVNESKQTSNYGYVNVFRNQPRGNPNESTGGYVNESSNKSYGYSNQSSGGYVNESSKSGGYVNESSKSGGYVNESSKSGGYVNESYKPSGGYVNESSKSSGGYVNETSARPSSGYVNESAKPSGGYVNESSKSSRGYVNESAKYSGGYVNESSKSSGGYVKESTARSSGGYVNESAKTSGGYVNESSKSSGGYVNEASKTSGGYVNEASKTTKSSGGYVNEAAQSGYTMYHNEEELGNRNYYREYEDYIQKGDQDDFIEDEYFDDDYGYDMGGRDFDNNNNDGDEGEGEEGLGEGEEGPGPVEEEPDDGGIGDDGEAIDEEGYDANAEIQLDHKKKREQKYRPTPHNATPVVLMVAEKPSIAKSIAEAISHGKCKQRKGVSKFCPVYDFYGSFKTKQAHFKVTSVAGHVYSTDFPRQYQDWKKIDPFDLFKVHTIKKEANPKSRLCLHLRKEARNATYIVLWLDNDKEGENICFEVLENTLPTMYSDKFQQVYRARFSSIVQQDLVAAFESIHEEPNLNESMSVDARQVIDLKIGVAFSRFQTLYFTQKYPQLNARLISYGPCQTPTLGFCVARHDEILTFKPKTFYRVVPTIATSNGQLLDLMWDAEKTFSVVSDFMYFLSFRVKLGKLKLKLNRSEKLL
jgi:DNA topoisomerase/Toprim domain/Mucin-like